MSLIPAVLILQGNQTYGRCSAKGGGRCLYKCVPRDATLPPYLVPYEIKHAVFSKAMSNQYVLMRDMQHSQQQKQQKHSPKHPLGQLAECLGPVEDVRAFYEWSLHGVAPPALRKVLRWALSRDHEARLDAMLMNGRQQQQNVFTIDPEGCRDIDDAISVCRLPANGWRVSVYIANVAAVLEAMELWEQVDLERTTSVYMPHRKIGMLPGVLSDGLCSLLAGQPRAALIMDVHLSSDATQVEHVSFRTGCVCVSSNFAYESEALLRDPDYRMLQWVTRQQMQSPMADSHDVVQHWMVFMNGECAKRLAAKRCSTALFRESLPNASIIPEFALSASYRCVYQNNGAEEVEEVEEKEEKEEEKEPIMYTHITSPIRRLADLLNLISFQNQEKLCVFSDAAQSFLRRGTAPEQIAILNDVAKRVRRLQTECQLLETCTQRPEVLAKQYSAYCCSVDAEQHASWVFLPELRLVAKVKASCLALLSEVRVQLYLFVSEDRAQRKIRACLV